MFGMKNRADFTEVVQQGVQAMAEKQRGLQARRDSALSAFRTAADELSAVNEGLQETVDLAAQMADFFAGRRDSTVKAIQDNDAVRQKILDIIGE